MRSLLVGFITLAACTDITPGPFDGTLSGTISGSSIGPLGGVTLTIMPNGSQTSLTATTSIGGAYTIQVAVGSGAITLSALPNTCQTPPNTDYSVADNTTSVVNITVSCGQTPQTGSITGTVTSTLGGGIANAQVTLTPSSGSPLPAVVTDSNGNYSVSAVPPGSGTLTVANLPSNCAMPGAQPYGGLTPGQSVTVAIAVTCAASEGFLVYNGTTSYAEIPSAPQLSVGAKGLTVAVWMRPDALSFARTEGSLANQQYVHWLGKGTNGDQEWTFRMYGQTNPAGPRANRISFYVFNATGGLGCGSYFQDPVTPGQWIHVVGVVDATAQTTTIYKNGVMRNTNSYAGIISPTPGSEPMRLGTKDMRSFFQGAIGPVRVWNRALSASEVAALYGSNTAAQDGLVAEYLANEGHGATLTDDVVGNNGALFNTAWGSGPRTPVSTAAKTQSGGGC